MSRSNEDGLVNVPKRKPQEARARAWRVAGACGMADLTKGLSLNSCRKLPVKLHQPQRAKRHCAAQLESSL